MQAAAINADGTASDGCGVIAGEMPTFRVAGLAVAPACYANSANCDNSTQPPILNVLDFSCFLNRFAAGCSSC